MVDTVKTGFPVIIPGGMADLASAQEFTGDKTFSGANVYGAVTAAELTRVADVSARIVAVTAATLAVDLATHEGKIVTLSLAAGTNVTLPAATGGGAVYTFVIVTDSTSTDTYSFAVTGNDTIFGHAFGVDGDGEPGNAWTAAGATSAAFGGTNNASGGKKGDKIQFTDIAADTWLCEAWITQGGTEVTPFAGP